MSVSSQTRSVGGCCRDVRRLVGRLAGPGLGVVVLGVLVWRLGTGPFLAGVRAIRPGPMLLAVAMTALSTLGASWRWSAIATALGSPLRLPAAVGAYYRSQLIDGLLPGGVLGDVERAVRQGAPGRRSVAARSVLWERGFGQLVQLVLTGLALIWLADAPPPSRADPGWQVELVRTLGILGALGMLGAIGVATVLAAASGVRRRLASVCRPPVVGAVVAGSVLAIGGHVATVVTAARAAGLDPAAVPLRVLVPLALLMLTAAAVPLNVGGWGPREGAAAWLFAQAGLGAATGVATATAFGLLALLALVPGLLASPGRWLVGLVTSFGHDRLPGQAGGPAVLRCLDAKRRRVRPPARAGGGASRRMTR